MDLRQEIAQGERQEGRIHRALGRFKAFTGRHRIFAAVYKAVVTLVGSVIVLAGVIMLIAPGPGWLAIFLGLGILGTEFEPVHRLNLWAKAKVLSIWHRWRERRAEKRQRKAEQRLARQQVRIARCRHHERIKAAWHARHICAPHRPPRSRQVIRPVR